MPSHEPPRDSAARQAKEIGERVRILLGNESVVAFAKRLGVSRQWLHDILSGRVPREASVATLSSIADIMGYSLEWLATGKGMPNDQWSAKTTLVSRLVPQTNARNKITLKKLEGELALVPISLLSDLEANFNDLGVLSGENLGMRPLLAPSDEVLVDLKDHKLVKDGLFIAQVQDHLAACRAIKIHSAWLLSPTESVKPESLIEDFRILGRIRLIWKRV